MTACPKCGREPRVLEVGYPMYPEGCIYQISCQVCIVDDPILATDAHDNLHTATHQWDRLVKEWIEAHPKPVAK